MYNKLKQFRKLKKYISWNIISIVGYIGIIITMIFLMMYSIAASNLNMRYDLNEFYTDYISKHIFKPYIDFYKFQIFVIVMLLIGFAFEYRHNNENNLSGLQLFENHEKFYSVIFYSGLICNIIPLNIIIIVLISILIKIINAMV